ncbi:MAG: NAD(P)/FAD-dependent oxidoreductase [Actinomycetota bacterium]
MSEPLDAVVIGSGPNGLAAAVTLALAGRSVVVYEGADHLGGGLASRSLAEPGWIHDLCASVHPLGVASPFFRDLTDRGLLPDLWRYAEVEFAQPLDGGDAAVAVADLDDTASGFGIAADLYRRYVGPVSRRLDDVLPEILRPPIQAPSGPRALLPLASFGARAAWPFTWLANRIEAGRGADGQRMAALLSGCAAHAIMPLHRPATSAFAVLFAASAHQGRWPLAAGGSSALADALAHIVTERGGRIELDHRVALLDELPRHRVALFDTNPAQVADIAGNRLSGGDRRRLRRFKHGPGAFKIDYTLDGPVPWTNDDCTKALTLHLGGTAAEIIEAEADVAAGRHAERPFMIVVQPSIADPTRAPAGKHVLWAYCHVPNGSTVDMTEPMERQIERFAPGFRDVVRTRTVSTTEDFEARNPNYVGGDIGGGSMLGTQLLFRPSIKRHLYDTSNPGVLICSASTAPGAGVHGMAGHHAANRALATVLA